MHISDEGIDAMESVGAAALVTVICEQFGLSFFECVARSSI